MGKSVFIAEKPSVAQEFGKALHENFTRRDGFLESDNYIVTWCVGHLVTMSYPEKYDEKLKRIFRHRKLSLCPLNSRLKWGYALLIFLNFRYLSILVQINSALSVRIFVFLI